MKRYVMAKIMAEEIDGIGLVYRHRLQQLTDPNHVDYIAGMDFVAGVDQIPANPDGTPAAKAVLCLVRGVKHAKIKSDPHVVALPQVWLDDKIGNIHTETKIKCKAALKALGIDASEIETIFANADGFRDVVNHFGRQARADFDSDDFDLSED